MLASRPVVWPSRTARTTAGKPAADAAGAAPMASKARTTVLVERELRGIFVTSLGLIWRQWPEMRLLLRGTGNRPIEFVVIHGGGWVLARVREIDRRLKNLSS